MGLVIYCRLAPGTISTLQTLNPREGLGSLTLPSCAFFKLLHCHTSGAVLMRQGWLLMRYPPA